MSLYIIGDRNIHCILMHLVSSKNDKFYRHNSFGLRETSHSTITGSHFPVQWLSGRMSKDDILSKTRGVIVNWKRARRCQSLIHLKWNGRSSRVIHLFFRLWVNRKIGGAPRLKAYGTVSLSNDLHLIVLWAQDRAQFFSLIPRFHLPTHN